MNPHALEREIRLIPGVVACTVTESATSVLVDSGAQARTVEQDVAAVVARHRGPALHLLVPGSPAAPRRARPLAFAVVGASAAMAAAVVPMAFRSLPQAPHLLLREAPRAASEPPSIIAGPAGTVGRVPGSATRPATATGPSSVVTSVRGFTPAPARAPAAAPAAPAPATPPHSGGDARECDGHHAYGYVARQHDDNGKHLGHSCVNEERRR